MKLLKFTHFYYKLMKKEFTTIRGKTSYGQFEVGEVVQVEIEGSIYFEAKVTGKSISKLKDLPLSFLKQDGEYKGFSITSKEDFVSLINSFYPPFYQQATLESEKTIFFFEVTHYFPIFHKKFQLVTTN